MNAPAYRADGEAVSREQFYRLACDPGRSCVVEACAGAGKTWILVSRILRALLDGARPQEVLAITFTRKAAGEMQQRLNEWLLEFSDPALTQAKRAEELVARGVAPQSAARLAPDLAQLHARLLNEVRGVQVQTFHAWFAQLLRSAPGELLDELGLQRDVELIETIDEHRTAVWRRFHAAVREDAACRADFEALCARRGRTRLREWLEAALERRIEIERADQAGTLEASVAGAAQVWPELAAGQHPAQTLHAPIWRACLRELATELARGGARAQNAAQRLTQALDEADAVQGFTLAWEALFTDKGRRELGSAAGLPEVQARLERLAEQAQQHDAQLEHVAMVRLSRVLLTEYAAYKRAQGLADMADLEGCALALLRDGTLSGWVQERLDARYRHVLIDEFQDTSPLQWQALHAWLMGYAGAGGGASGQRPPSIFIVGDPKQSIYRFRRAEPRVFEAVRVFVRDALDGVILECDHTRRNAPQIVEPLNDVFMRASELGELGAYRRHSTEVRAVPCAGIRVLPSVLRPISARTGTKPDSGAAKVWRNSLSTPRHSVDEVLREEEARRVAAAVAELVRTEAIPAHEIMVLCRKRQSLRLAATALRELHIPFVAVEDHALLDAPEVRDLVAVLDVLASPGHDLSLAQALRCPLFGASDEDLMTLAQQRQGRGSWWAALMQVPQPAQVPQGSPVLQRARELLQGWRSDATRLPPHDLLERIVHQGEYRERVAQCVPPDQCRAALDAIDALLAQALTLDGARYATPYNFVRALKRRSVRVVSPARADAVQLLTVHGAKGLEARAVFVMDTQPEAATSRPPGVLVDWPVHAPAPLCCAFVYSEARCPTSLRDLRQAEREARLREELNGLYVALTRAKERLVLSATEPHRAEPGPSWWDRMAPHAAAWELAVPAHAGFAPAAAPDAPVRLKVLPRWERGGDLAPHPPRTDTPTEGDSAAMQRLGRAVHRFLEWATPGVRSAAVQVPEQLAENAAREFGASAEQVLTIGSAILTSPESAPFFDRTALRWSGNEVPVSLNAQLLRIDRLCQFDAAHGGAWWVLDYKLAHRPEQLEPYREQLLRYREAVTRLEPGAVVRCAFLTGQGRLIEIG
jgi:ATP-dependent helicase/nuclease subunit A